MKKLLSVFALLGLLVACDEIKSDKDTLELGIGDVTISADGGSQTVTFVPVGDWTAKADQSWVNIDPTSGGIGLAGDIGEASLTVTVDPNGSSSSRTAKITVTMGGETGSFRVVQDGSDDDNNGNGEGGPKLMINIVGETAFISPADASSFKVLIDSEYDSEPYAENNWPAWISVSKPAKRFIDDAEMIYGEYYESTVTLTPNTGSAARSFVFTYRGSIEGKTIESQAVTILQNAPNGGGEEQKQGDIILNDSYPLYNYRNFAGDSFTIGVVSSVIVGGVRMDYNYPDYAPYAENWPDWINVSKTFTSDWRYTTDLPSDDNKVLINSHTVTLSRNTPDAERSFSFVFRGKKSDGTVLESEQITVSQSAAANGKQDQKTFMFVCLASDTMYEGSFDDEGTHNHTFDIYVYDPNAVLRVESGDTSWLNADISGTGDKRTLNVAISWPAAAGKIGDITVCADKEDKSERYTFTMDMSRMQQ